MWKAGRQERARVESRAMDAPFLSIIIPAYNEERRIQATLDAVTQYLAKQPYAAEVFVVDDGSTDATPSLVSGYECSGCKVQLISLPHRGKGSAVKAGMLKAQGHYRFLCDADLAMPIEQLERFLPPNIDSWDIVIGSREAPGAQRYDEPPFRHLMGRVFNLIIRTLAIKGIRDTQCGFKLFRGDVAQRLFTQQRLDGFGFDVEILFLAQRSGLLVKEVPIDWYYGSESKVRPLHDSIATLRETLQVRWNHVRGRYQK